jgi:hypothetical protein
MRKMAITGWLLVPLGALALHYGPGQGWSASDDAARRLREADAAAARGEWDRCVAACDEALRLIPPERTGDLQRVRLAKARARLATGALPESYADLEALVDEIGRAKPPRPELLEEARAAWANAQYYMTWRLRLEGAGEAEWLPVAEGARQTYRSLAEEASARGDAARAELRKKDLDSSIRLARMSLDELEALPLPNQ